MKKQKTYSCEDWQAAQERIDRIYVEATKRACESVLQKRESE